MTLEIQLLRTASRGVLVPVERISSPTADLELAKEEARRRLESPDRDPSVQAARIIDADGNELYVCRVENELGWA
jgi:hypothetical protein